MQAGGVYGWQDHSWPLRDDAVFVGVLHDGGRRFAAIAWIAVLLAWGASTVETLLFVI